MIPLKLQLKNFLSYGDTLQTIDFAPYSLICLSGKNGHGKSALLDAITWALWGQARKIAGVAKSDDNLLRLGQSTMTVALHFACNGQEYQVRRDYTKSASKNYSTLDVGLWDPEKKAFMSMGGNSIKSNQAVIDSIVRLDFDSFCNSAFLRQGQSNEFCKKSPTERKDILATILCLEQYERMRLAASEKMRAAMNQQISIQAIIERMNADIAQKETVNNAYQAIHDELQKIAQQEKKIDMSERELAALLQTIQSLRDQHRQCQLAIANYRQENERITQERARIAHEWRTTHRKKRRMPQYAQLQERKQELVKQMHEYQQQLHTQLTNKEHYLACKEKIQFIEQHHTSTCAAQMRQRTVELEQTRAQQQQCVHALEAVKKQQEALTRQLMAARSDHDLLRTQHAALAVDSQAVQAREKQFEKRKACYQQLMNAHTTINTEIGTIEQKKQLAGNTTNPCCPLCEQNLSAARRRFLQEKFARDQAGLEHRKARIARITPKLKELLIVQHQEIKTAAAQTQEQQKIAVMLSAITEKEKSLQAALTMGNEQIAHYQQQSDTLIQLIESQEKALHLAEQEQARALQNNEHYRQLQDIVKTFALTMGSQQSTIQQQEACRLQLEQIERDMTALHELSTELASQEQRMHAVATAGRELKKIRATLAHASAELAGYALYQDKEKIYAAEHTQIKREKQELVTQKESLLQQKGALEQKKAALELLARDQANEIKRCATITETIQDYQALVGATGKDGIQALLIHDLLPEVEAEANRLLAKLTDNQAHLFIESLRDLKKGGAKETLDINISDSMGIRPYEMFSGGEAFRIDFALRVALSKMLARRAGTSLQTLIIDEGFGSQDEEGLSHILDALYKIQQDFAKIIIVSHLNTMKDQFPVHFYVEKKPMGSVVSVIEQS